MNNDQLHTLPLLAVQAIDELTISDMINAFETDLCNPDSNTLMRDGQIMALNGVRESIGLKRLKLDEIVDIWRKQTLI